MTRIGEKSLNQKVREGIISVFPNFDPEEVPNNRELGDFRSIRAKIAHPLSSRDIFPDDVIEGYKKLQKFLSDLFKSV